MYIHVYIHSHTQGGLMFTQGSIKLFYSFCWQPCVYEKLKMFNARHDKALVLALVLLTHVFQVSTIRRCYDDIAMATMHLESMTIPG